LPAKAKLLRHEGDKTWFELTITEGRNQQVRRMGEATGFSVMRLSRISFAGITAEGLRPGQWRFLTASELAQLKEEYGVPRRVVSPPVQEPLRPAPTAKPRASTTRRPDPRTSEPDRDRSYGRGAPAGRESATGRSGPRSSEPRRDRSYGGGVPARRDITGSDAQGESHRRGSSWDAARDTPRPDVGARSGRSRTTGTGGGIGAGPGSYRIRGRHG
jgi:23S rRNA pseudouridine2605 synthase